MITLNGERGFEKVESWEEITELPGFTANLDPKQYKLNEIIGRYIFKDKIPCGLTTCKQPHGKGYIVSTKSGEVTNIGNRCGKTHFGVEFNELSKIFDRAVTEHNNRELVGSFLFQLEEHQEQLSSLRAGEKGADWIYKTSKALSVKGRGCPDSVTEFVNKLIRSRSGAILIPRMATEDEVKEMEVIQNKSLERPQYIEEPKGELKGLEVLYEENDIRELVVLDIESNLKTLSELDVDSATFKELQHWSKWCSEFEAKIEKIESVIASGLRFLTLDNLQQLLTVVEDHKELKEFKKWLTSNLKNT